MTSIEPRRPSTSALVRPRQRWTSRSTDSPPIGSPVMVSLVSQSGSVGRTSSRRSGRGVGAQAEHRRDERERRRGRPRLRRAGDRVGDGRADRRPVVAAEQLRQPEVREPLGGLDEPAGDGVRAVGRAGPLEAGRGQRVVVRPDGARCDSRPGCSPAGRRRRSGSPSPRTGRARASARPRSSRGASGGRSPTRAPGPAFEPMVAAGSLVAVEGHRVEADIAGSQNAASNRSRSAVGVDVETGGQLDVAAMPRQPGHRPSRGVGVALDLGQGDRALGTGRRRYGGSRRPNPSSPGCAARAASGARTRGTRRRRGRPTVSIQSSAASACGQSRSTSASSPVQAWISPSRISQSGVESTLP